MQDCITGRSESEPIKTATVEFLFEVVIFIL